jgi:ATP-dependent DNA helicase RecG
MGVETRHKQDVATIDANVGKPSGEVSRPSKTPEKSSPISSPESSPIGSLKTGDIILGMFRRNQAITTELLATKIGISKRAILKQIATLKKQGRIRRLGPTHGGHWQTGDKNEG